MTDGGSTETTDASSGEIDTQLAEMQTAETAEPAENTAPAETSEERPEVKKVVPLAALHEERRARQALQAELAQTRRENAENMQRINQRLESLAPKAQLPDRDAQPVEYLDHRLNEVSQAQQYILQRDQQREQQAGQQAAIARVQSAVINQAASFAKETADFGDAVNHLNAMRTRELIALGADPAQAETQAVQELDQAAMAWAAQGRNAAQTSYELAKARGFTSRTQTPDQRIEAQRKGTAAAKSLGGGGAVSGGKLTAEALANMSDDDFAKLSESQFRQAMGG